MRKAFADLLHRLDDELNYLARYLAMTFAVVVGYLGVTHLPEPALKADPPAIEKESPDVPAEREIAKQHDQAIPAQARTLYRAAQYRVVTEDVNADDPSMSEVKRLMHGDRPVPRPAPPVQERFERSDPIHVAAPIVVNRLPARVVREAYPPARRIIVPPRCPPYMHRHVRRMPPPRRHIRFQDMYRERQPRGYRVVRPGRPYRPARPNYPVRAYGGVPPWVVVR